MKVESGVKTVNYSQESVYAKIADLNNMAGIRDRFNDPKMQERIKGNFPEDKINNVRKTLDTMTLDADSVSIDIHPVGNISIQIIDREPPKAIKFISTNSPVKFTMWIQLLPAGDTTCLMKITIETNVTPFLRGMIEKPLREGVDKLADLLSTLPYE